MKEWWTVRELAGLPGMPGTARGVRYWAERSACQSRERGGRGGGREYHGDGLPEETRKHLGLISASPDALSDDERQARMQALARSLAQLNECEPYKRERARARMRVLQAHDHFLVVSGLSRRDGTDQFVGLYNAGQIAMDAEAKAECPMLTARTLEQWRRRERDLGVAGLATRYGNRLGTGRIDSDEELRMLILGLIYKTPHIRGWHVHEYLLAKRPDAASSLSVRTLERWMTRWKAEHAQIFMRLTNPDQWKNEYQAAFGSASENILRLNQLWEMDSTPADVMLADGRHSVIGVIDVFSRRFKLLVSKTSKATMIATLFRRATLKWGVCEALKHDRGQDYKSQYFSEVLRALEIDQIVCLPFRGDQKPHIERAFKTFSHGLLELLASYIGHDVAEREALRARQSFAERLLEPEAVLPIEMHAAELQRFCDDWCENVYERNPHDGLDGKTPFQVAAEWSQPVRRIADERALDMLLLEAPKGSGRSIGKKGISVDGAWFVHDALAPRIGERVAIKLDPDDIGRIFVFVFEGDAQKFLCVAECPERTGISRKEVAAVARARQQQAMRDARAMMKEAKRPIDKEDIHATIIESRKAQAAKVRALPRKSDVHTTPELEAAADAARAVDLPPSDAPVDQAALERGGRLLEIKSSERREKSEREAADEAVRRRYFALRDRGAETWSAEEAAWMAMMAKDAFIQSWVQLEKLRAATAPKNNA